MANFKIRPDSYIRFREELSMGLKRPPYQRVLKWLILGAIVIIMSLLKQYAFIAIILVFSGFIAWAGTKKGAKRFYRGEYTNDLFVNRNVSVTFEESALTITAELNKLTLSLENLEIVKSLTECYYLRHYSGASLFIPKYSLNEEEIIALKKLVASFDTANKKKETTQPADRAYREPAG